MDTDHLHRTIDAILERNVRVEAEKAWETSWTRRLSIALLTYLTAAVFLWIIGDARFPLDALVPTGGYLLSTLSLPWIKRRWIAQHQTKLDAA